MVNPVLTRFMGTNFHPQIVDAAMTYQLVRPILIIWVVSHSQELVPTSDSNLAKSLMYLFEMLMKEACEDEKTAKENKNLKIWIVVGNASCPSPNTKFEVVVHTELWYSPSSPSVHPPLSFLPLSPPFFLLWCGQWVLPVIRTAMKSLMLFFVS